ncbi:snRNA-activating protein complex subunit 2 [Ambystoma mexicanum]|uniref:snRNA-activating protein complex subunit 2 n=1 Tax=Ambystoma mexicanum TaxID=8296 RepID=UPI0037E84C97
MKPPLRRRVAPMRLAIDPKFLRHPNRCLWAKKEKICLLRALKEQAHQKELDLGVLAQKLPRKKEIEIMDFIRTLKGRVAREAIQKQYKNYRAEKFWGGEPILAPIEVWTELADKVSDKLEEAVSAAFSQILTIAATEPTSLLHSIPTKPTKIPEKKLLLEPASANHHDHLTSPASQSNKESVSLESIDPSTQESSSEEEDRKPNVGQSTLDFENIYKYLFALSHGSTTPELSSFESAVLLDLLLSLPKELEQLDCLALRSHMYQSFRSLNMPLLQAQGSPDTCNKEVLDNGKSATEPPSKPGEEIKGAPLKDSSSLETSKDPGSASIDPTGLGRSTSSQQPSATQAVAEPLGDSGKTPALGSKPPWEDLGVCPLNVFHVPIKFLSQVDKDEA